jgi:hypothetical protein
MNRIGRRTAYAMLLILAAVIVWEFLKSWNLADWNILFPYLLGVLTGAALTGWSPAFLDRWEERREERRRQRVSDRMRDLVKREADRIDREKGPPA